MSWSTGKKLLVGSFIIGAIYMATRKKNKDFTEQDGKDAVLAVEKRYGIERAKIVEKILRAETAHFKSVQYKKTGSAGMLVNPSWGATINKLPTVDINLKQSQEDAENTGKTAKYYVFPSVTYFAYFLSDYIDRHNGDYLDWRSTTNNTYRQQYATLLNSIQTRFV